MKRMMALVCVGLTVLALSTVALADPHGAGDMPYNKTSAATPSVEGM